MAYYTLTYRLADDYLERRGEFRAEHLAHVARFRESGLLHLAGAYAKPADEALLVFDANEAAEVEAFAKTDPYVREGLVSGWRVRRWMVVSAANAAPTPPGPPRKSWTSS